MGQASVFTQLPNLSHCQPNKEQEKTLEEEIDLEKSVRLSR